MDVPTSPAAHYYLGLHAQFVPLPDEDGDVAEPINLEPQAPPPDPTASILPPYSTSIFEDLPVQPVSVFRREE
jgi:hypothetical protein